MSDWGDNYGNRVDRFLATVAYLDGQRPSLVMARGYYTRTVLAAWNWRDGALTNVWTFDTGHTGTANPIRGLARAGQPQPDASGTWTATARTRSSTAPPPSTTTAPASTRPASATATRCT